MPSFNLFPHERIIGVFRGFSEGGLEFHAQLVLPYRSDFQNIPMHGQFVLVQLETAEEAVLDRIEDGTYAVLLVDEQETEFVVPAEQLPDDATPGKWLRVRIEEGTITAITVDEEATQEAAARIASKLDALRKRGRGSSGIQRIE